MAILLVAFAWSSDVTLDPYAQAVPAGFMEPYFDVMAVGWGGALDFKATTATDATTIHERVLLGFGVEAGVRMFGDIAAGVGYEYETSSELATHIWLAEARWIFPVAPGLELYARMAGLVSMAKPDEEFPGHFRAGYGGDVGFGISVSAGPRFAFFADAAFRYLVYDFHAHSTVIESDDKLGGGAFVARVGIEFRP